MSAHRYTYSSGTDPDAAPHCIWLCTFAQTMCWRRDVILHRHCFLHSLTLFSKNDAQGRRSAEDTRRWRIGSCSQLGLSIRKMKVHRDEWASVRRGCFFSLADWWRVWMGEVGDKEKKGLEKGGKMGLRGKQLLKRSNTGEGDTLTSCMCYHGYKSPACHLFLAFLPFSSPWHSGVPEAEGRHKRGREEDDDRREGYKRLRGETTNTEKETSQIRVRLQWDEGKG